MIYDGIKLAKLIFTAYSLVVFLRVVNECAFKLRGMIKPVALHFKNTLAFNGAVNTVKFPPVTEGMFARWFNDLLITAWVLGSRECLLKGTTFQTLYLVRATAQYERELSEHQSNHAHCASSAHS